MFGIINDYKHLYVADFSKFKTNDYKIVYSCDGNLVVDGTVISPFAEDIRTGTSIIVNNGNHVKRLSYYVNCFGLPRKRLALGEKDKQSFIVSEIKALKKMGKI